jgi:hypothetical protein
VSTRHRHAGRALHGKVAEDFIFGRALRQAAAVYSSGTWGRSWKLRPLSAAQNGQTPVRRFVPPQNVAGASTKETLGYRLPDR